MTTYRFPCGCEFPVLQPAASSDVLPLLDFTVESVNPDCPETWNMLSKGDTKGVFQLESPLGRQWTKKLQPQHIEHLCALGALLRPGCLRAEMEPGVSMTKLYCLRKNGEAPVSTIHPVLDAILEPTYQVLVYQEQSMRLGRDIAGFDLKDVDRLRKAIGKKDQQEMAAVEKLFLEGAKQKNVVPYELAETVWGWIKKSGRYQFNKSHSLSYGVIGYLTAYLKAHFPVQFFCSWLYYAKDKANPLEEVRELINDARLFSVEVEPPDLRNGESHFSTDGRKVVFGLSDIKGVGEAMIVRLKENIDLVERNINKEMPLWTWHEFLTRFSHQVSSSIIERLIKVGGLRWMGVPRARMLAEHKAWSALTDKEQEWIRETESKEGLFGSTIDALKRLSRPKGVKAKPKSRRVPRTDDPLAVAELQIIEQEHETILADLAKFAMDQEAASCSGGPPVDNEVEKSLEKARKANRARYRKLTKVVKEGPVQQEGPFGGCFTEKRRLTVESEWSLLENPPSKIADFPNWLATIEEELLGIPLTCSRVDSMDRSQVTVSCKDYLCGQSGYLIFCVEIESCRTVKTKRGKNPGSNMAFLSLNDGTCALTDVVVFPDTYKEYGHLLSEKNCVIIQGERDKQQGTLIVKKVWQAV
jgi:DNA polymerase III alpha subunit